MKFKFIYIGTYFCISIKYIFCELVKYCNNTYGQSSNSNDLTLLICEPKFLCIPEHSIHIKTPKFKLAHSGSINIVKYNIVINYLQKFVYIMEASSKE